MLPACLLALLSATAGATDTRPPAAWQAYWLTGGPGAAKGYQKLLVTRVGLAELARPGAVGSSATPLLESPAILVETLSRRSVWNSDRRPIKVPSLTCYDVVNETIAVDGVVHRLESAAVADALAVLRDNTGPVGVHRTHAPLAGMERTAAALAALIQAETVGRDAPTRLHVGGSFGGTSATISTTIAEPHPRAGTRHGPELGFGPGLRLRRYSVYDDGFLLSRDVYIEDGFQLVADSFTRRPPVSWAGADGIRHVSRRAADGRAETAAEGFLREGKPWRGSFIFVEVVPGNKSFAYPVRLVRREYKDGTAVAETADVTLGFGRSERDQAWLKALPRVLRAP